MSEYCVKKHILLTAVGVGLQTAGTVCLIAAAFGIGKEINLQIKKTIVRELSKQISEE